MRYTLMVLIIVGALLVIGCSSPSLTGPGERTAQGVVPVMSPTLAFQLNATCFIDPPPPGHLLPLDIPLGKLGLASDEVVRVLEGATLVNACCPYEVDVPEWDEWLLSTFYEVDVPEWDEWLLSTTYEVDVPEWDEWLLRSLFEVDVPEWDEWLLRFEAMDKYRSTEWKEWAFKRPLPLEVDVPEWDEWLLSLTLGEMARSYDAWWELHLLNIG